MFGIQSSILSVERSVLGNRWVMRCEDERGALAISQRLGCAEILARVLAGRGVGVDDAEKFLAPTLRDFLPDPSHFKDMDAAAERLAAAVVAEEPIGIFGDYDVDGATSSAVLKTFFQSLGCRVEVYIPDRMKEGYGPNAPALLAFKARGIGVLVTVDCGTLAFEPLAAAHEAGIDVIVVDHHAGEPTLPKAFAVVNPNRFDETSDHRHLAAVGMSFMLVVAVNRVLRSQGWYATHDAPDLMTLLDLVALGTVCDVVPLTGVNRAFVAQGLKVLAGRSRPGLRVLMDVAGLDETPACYHLGYVLGPRINAGGRVGESDLGVRLLTTQDEAEALAIAQQLSHYNDERRAIESIVQEQAVALVEQGMLDHPVLVVHGEGWHAGVIGIVAGRLKEQYQRPVAIVAMQNGVGKASARSIAGVDIGAAVIAARQDGLLQAGGGHAMAAGFTVAEHQLDAFRQFLHHRLGDAVSSQQQDRKLKLDGWMRLAGLNVELATLLEQAGPFGAGNSQVRLGLAGVKIVRIDRVGSDHLRCIVAESGADRTSQTIKAMAFRSAQGALGQALMQASGRPIHLAGQLRRSFWQGEERAEFIIDDVAMASV